MYNVMYPFRSCDSFKRFLMQLSQQPLEYSQSFSSGQVYLISILLN